jgi:hypothetical protein
MYLVRTTEETLSHLTKPSLFRLFRVIIAVSSENHKKHMGLSIFSDRNARVQVVCVLTQAMHVNLAASVLKALTDNIIYFEFHLYSSYFTLWSNE